MRTNIVIDDEPVLVEVLQGFRSDPDFQPFHEHLGLVSFLGWIVLSFL